MECEGVQGRGGRQKEEDYDLTWIYTGKSHNFIRFNVLKCEKLSPYKCAVHSWRGHVKSM